MRFEEPSWPKNLGKLLGFLCSYALFTIVLHIIAVFGYHAVGWRYWYAIITALGVVVIGFLIKRVLK